jgi:hypothetical protein
MKKLLAFLAIFGFLAHGAAHAGELIASGCPIAKTKPTCPKKEKVEKCTPKKTCSKAATACDETRYAADECWLDNQYKRLLRQLDLCPDKKSNVDADYRKLKNCLEPLERQLDCERAKVCVLIAKGGTCQESKADLKQAKKDVKATQKEMKRCFKQFRVDVKPELTGGFGGEKHKFDTFMRKEGGKLKKMNKYCIERCLPCLPCSN